MSPIFHPNNILAQSMVCQQTLLEWIVGNEQSQAGELKLKLLNFPESWGVFVLLAVVAAVVMGVIWLYQREIQTCPPTIKMVLAGIRLAVLLLLIAMYLKPSIFYQEITEIKPAITVLRDSSLSLARGDKYRDAEQAKRLAELSGLPAEKISSGDLTRLAIVETAMDKHPELIEQMREKGSVRILNFADTAEIVSVLPATASESETEDSEDGEDSEKGGEPKTDGDSGADGEDAQDEVETPTAFPALAADGLGTNIWQALNVALEDSSRISSIVLLSEGQHNGAEDPIELAEKAASLGIPVITIGIGDPNPPRNLKITEVYVRNKVYPGDTFEVESVLQTSRRNQTGLPPKVTVTLYEQRIDSSSGSIGAANVVASQAVEVPEDGGRIPVDFYHANNAPGRYIYTVAVEELDGETNTDDNQLTSSELEIVDEPVKVLLIAGLPNWDYQQVQRLLKSNETVSLTCWLQSMDQSRPQEGNETISQLPRTMAELQHYNMVIMMDPNPAEFDDQWARMLKDFCKTRGGGFLFMAGPQFSAEFLTLNRLKGFRDLLPVGFGDNEFIDSAQAIANATGEDSGTMQVVGHNLDHAVMSFTKDRQQSEEIWGLMPGISWSFPTKNAKATARVLIERGDLISADGNQPLLVSGRYGAGSVLFFGFQGTWKWRSIGLQAHYFGQFWEQVVGFLKQTRSLQGARRGFLDPEKSEYELGQRVVLFAKILNDQFQPSTEATVKAIVTSDEGLTETVELGLLPHQAGRYEGSFEARRPGNYQVTVDLGAGSASEDPEEELIEPISFRIVTPSAETGAYWLNESLLVEIAEKSGGHYIPLDQIQRLPELLPTKITRVEFNSPPRPLWDANNYLRWFVFLLPAVLLSAEWALRKYYKLL